VPRNRTLTLVWSGSREGRWIDYELWNPYAIGSNHQNGPGIFYEPLAYYSAFADKEYLWLAESYKYSPDFKELTIKTRSGIKWSDGTPFSADDVTYTLNSLKELGPKVRCVLPRFEPPRTARTRLAWILPSLSAPPALNSTNHANTGLAEVVLDDQ